MKEADELSVKFEEVEMEVETYDLIHRIEKEEVYQEISVELEEDKGKIKMVLKQKNSEISIHLQEQTIFTHMNNVLGLLLLTAIGLVELDGCSKVKNEVLEDRESARKYSLTTLIVYIAWNNAILTLTNSLLDQVIMF